MYIHWNWKTIFQWSMMLTSAKLQGVAMQFLKTSCLSASATKKSRLHNVIQYFCFIFFSSWSLDPGIKLMLHRKSSLLMCCAMIWHRSARGSTAIESMCFIMTCIEIMTGHMLISQGEKLLIDFQPLLSQRNNHLAQFKTSIRLDGVQQLGLKDLLVFEIRQLE